MIGGLLVHADFAIPIDFHTVCTKAAGSCDDVGFTLRVVDVTSGAKMVRRRGDDGGGGGSVG